MLLGLNITELMAMVKDPSKVAGAFARIAPVSLHTMARKRLYEEICATSAILSANAHDLLAKALVRKTEMTVAESQSLARLEMQLLSAASRLNDVRKIPLEGMSLDILKATYGIPPDQGPGGPGAQARDEGATGKGNGHAGTA